MALPTFMRFGNVTGDAAYWRKGYDLYNFTAYADPAGAGPGLWSEANGLFFRDASYFNKTSPNGSPVFWSRGNGWAISAMARAIAALPPGHAYVAEFTGKLTTMAQKLLTLQGSDGFWRASLLDAAQFANPETTGTSMFTYAIAWGVNHGLLERSIFEPALISAWSGLAGTALQSDGFVGAFGVSSGLAGEQHGFDRRLIYDCPSSESYAGRGGLRC